MQLSPNEWILALAIYILVLAAFSFTIGFQLAGWYYRKYPERNLSEGQALKKLWHAIKTWLHKWGEPEKLS